MEPLLAFVQTIGGVSSGLSGIVTILLAVMFMADKGWLTVGRMNSEEQHEDLAGKSAIELMQYLKAHYNDELEENIREMHKKQDETLTLMHEWEKYGIPVREKVIVK